MRRTSPNDQDTSRHFNAGIRTPERVFRVNALGRSLERRVRPAKEKTDDCELGSYIGCTVDNDAPKPPPDHLAVYRSRAGRSLKNDSAAGPSLPHLIKQSKAMRKKKNKASKRVHFQSLPLINPNAAGIDVGILPYGIGTLIVVAECQRSLY
jgi:hypothetical protein